MFPHNNSEWFSFLEVIFVIKGNWSVPPKHSKSTPTKLHEPVKNIRCQKFKTNPFKRNRQNKTKQISYRTAMQTTLTAEGTATRGFLKCF